MSSSGSIGSFGASSTQQLQQSQRGNFAARMKSDMESALKSSGVDQSKVSDIMKQIQDAADKARQSGGSRESVRSAVQDVLKANNVDISKFESAMKAQLKGHHPGAQGAQALAIPQPSDNDSDDQGAAMLRRLTGTGISVDFAA